jgi:hypothetical protein
MTDPVNQEYVRDCFEYADGRLYWKKRQLSHFLDEWRQKIFNSREFGREAGTLVSGYRMVNFSSKRISVHRLIFLLHHGFLPPIVDHINGNPLDNRIENLRAATHARNIQNMKTPKTNTSGFKGVYWHKKSARWVAGIRSDGKWKHLGSFKNIDDAVKCRKLSEQEIYGDFSNGR